MVIHPIIVFFLLFLCIHFTFFHLIPTYLSSCRILDIYLWCSKKNTPDHYFFNLKFLLLSLLFPSVRGGVGQRRSGVHLATQSPDVLAQEKLCFSEHLLNCIKPDTTTFNPD